MKKYTEREIMEVSGDERMRRLVANETRGSEIIFVVVIVAAIAVIALKMM